MLKPRLSVTKSLCWSAQLDKEINIFGRIRQNLSLSPFLLRKQAGRFPGLGQWSNLLEVSLVLFENVHQRGLALLGE